MCLYDSTDSSSHSPIIGWALDGYPIYGPFGYSSANDSSSSIKRLLPSYSLRTYANDQRTSLANGTVLSSDYYGPNVNSTYYLGYYLQDYQYDGSGDLDEYNGRWCVTPDYPSGTYAYFIATNSRFILILIVANYSQSLLLTFYLFKWTSDLSLHDWTLLLWNYHYYWHKSVYSVNGYKIFQHLLIITDNK